MSKTMTVILEIPLFWRVAVALFLVWVVYAIFAREVFKLGSLVTIIFNFVWTLIYRPFNNLTHVINKSAGKNVTCAIDQSVTDFFGSIHGVMLKIRFAIKKCCEIPLTDERGNHKCDVQGNPMYLPKRPFLGGAFVVVIGLTLLIALPTWLNIEGDTNLLTAPYRTYIDVEGKVLNMVFGER